MGQLVLERAVERRGGRYVLARNLDVARAIPPDMGAVWRRSLVASGAGESDLAALAIVRDRVSGEVVDALAQLLGDRFNSSFSRALGAGLLRKEGELYAFSHGLFRDYLLGRITPGKAPPLHALAAEALKVLVRVARRIAPKGVKRDKLVAEMAANRKKFVDGNRKAMQSDAWPMRPERILADLREVLPRDAILCTDVGWNKNGVGQQFPIYTPGSIHTPGGFATMGFGAPAALGAK